MANQSSTCADYGCEWDGKEDHTHIGVNKDLRKVIDQEGRLVDGQTGEIIQKEEKDV